MVLTGQDDKADYSRTQSVVSKSDDPAKKPTVDFKDEFETFRKDGRMSAQATKSLKQCSMCVKDHCWPKAVYHDKVTSRAKNKPKVWPVASRKGTVMPYIFVRDYDIDLMEMNKDIRHVFVESVLQAGGERKVAYLRQNERGLPLTLRENFCLTWASCLRTQRFVTSSKSKSNCKTSADCHTTEQMFVCRYRHCQEN